MSLIDSRMEDAVMLDLVSVPDGFGGILKEWRDGAAFRAAIVMKSTTDAEIAYQQGAKRLYTVYTRQIVRLERGDRFRRVGCHPQHAPVLFPAETVAAGQLHNLFGVHGV